MPISLEQFRKKVYQIVQSIPVGYVLSYGYVAVLAGRPQNARLVGKLLAHCPPGVPAHRVVTSTGRTVAEWPEQITKLRAEKIAFCENGTVDMRKHLWK